MGYYVQKCIIVKDSIHINNYRCNYMDDEDEKLHKFEIEEEKLKRNGRTKKIEEKGNKEESNKHENIFDHEIHYSILFYYCCHFIV